MKLDLKTFTIIEAGGTKTDVVVCSGDDVVYQNQFTGLNPQTFPQDYLIETIATIESEISRFEPTNVYYYGAGCSTDSSKLKISALFTLPIVVEHDLLATARGLLEKSSGIAIILGTGSNSCCYDGEHILANTPSLGYILGDEGGGVHLGKLLLRDYLHKKMPLELLEYMAQHYGDTSSSILEELYQHKNPNAFLAKFAKVLSENKELRYAQELIKHSFQSFIERYLMPYKTLEFEVSNEVWASGSIALVWEDLLRETLKEYSFNLKKVVKSPLEGLIEYHRNI